jgi:hypothetical protein
MGSAEGFGEVAVLATRQTLTALLCLLLAACTGSASPDPAALP